MLALLLRSKRLSSIFKDLLIPQRFQGTTSQAIAAAGIEFLNQFKSPPARETFLAFLEGKGIVGVKQLIGRIWAVKPQTSDVVFLQDIVIQFAREREVKKAVLQSRELLDRQDYKGIVQLFEEAIRVGEDRQNLGLSWEKNNDYLSIESEYNPNRVPTTLKHIDMLIGGGLGPGELGVIMTLPNRGKSAFLVNIAAGAIRTDVGKSGVYYTMEMSEERIATRLAYYYAGLTRKDLRKDPVAFEKALDHKKQQLQRGKLLIKHFPMRSIGVSTIKGHLTILMDQMPIDFVIVDYGQLLNPSHHTDTYEGIGEIYEQLCGMGQSFHIPVWTAIQAKRPERKNYRSAGNKPIEESPVLYEEEVSESWRVYAAADVFITLHRTRKEIQSGDTSCRFYMAKDRDDECGQVIDATADFARMRILTNFIHKGSQ